MDNKGKNEREKEIERKKKYEARKGTVKIYISAKDKKIETPYEIEKMMNMIAKYFR